MRVLSIDSLIKPARRDSRWRNFWRGLAPARQALVSHLAPRAVAEGELRKADATLNQAVLHRAAQGMRLR